MTGRLEDRKRPDKKKFSPLETEVSNEVDSLEVAAPTESVVCDEIEPLEDVDSSITPPTASASSHHGKQTVGTLQLAIIVFYSVSGESVMSLFFVPLAAAHVS